MYDYLSAHYLLKIELVIYVFICTYCNFNINFTLLCAELLKNIFLDVKNKFEKAMGVLRREKITIDPEDQSAVAQYANVMKTVREE